MFKVIAQDAENKRRIFYTLIDLADFNHARPNLHKAIKDHLDTGFYSDFNDPKDYELFWLDNEGDIILIKSWWDLHNYVAYLGPQGKNYLKLYVRPVGFLDEMEAKKQNEAEINKDGTKIEVVD